VKHRLYDREGHEYRVTVVPDNCVLVWERGHDPRLRMIRKDVLSEVPPRKKLADELVNLAKEIIEETAILKSLQAQTDALREEIRELTRPGA